MLLSFIQKKKRKKQPTKTKLKDGEQRDYMWVCSTDWPRCPGCYSCNRGKQCCGVQDRSRVSSLGWKRCKENSRSTNWQYLRPLTGITLVEHNFTIQRSLLKVILTRPFQKNKLNKLNKTTFLETMVPFIYLFITFTVMNKSLFYIDE